MWRGFDDALSLRASESRLLLQDRSLHFFAAKNEWEKDRLAAAARIGGQVRKAVAAVDQFFDYEEQN